MCCAELSVQIDEHIHGHRKKHKRIDHFYYLYDDDDDTDPQTHIHTNIHTQSLFLSFSGTKNKRFNEILREPYVHTNDSRYICAVHLLP